MVNVFVLPLLLVLVCCAAVGNSLTDDSPEVTITNGVIRGRTFVSNWTNQAIYAFQGIPYATPPVGPLRFKDPVPATNWTEPKDCVKEGATCFQSLTTPMSEDCLFLNVYTPNLNPDSGFPVLVWIHGGAFLSGSGNYSGQGPDKLVAQNITVVSINYRLGPFGFLTLGTSEAPGNAGLKDQRLALIWVQNEISKFGGDPAKVTIFGQSAGSACVHLHYLSPLSKGLFRSVIGDSGASLSPWAARSNEGSLFYALQLAGFLNCSSTNVSSAYDCLMATDAVKINQFALYGSPSPEDLANGQGVKFIPTVDKTTSDNPFLPELPVTLMDQKQDSLIPFLMGFNRDEGLIGLPELPAAEANVTSLMTYFIPPDVRKRSSLTELQYLAEQFSQFYFNSTNASETNVKGLFDINTDQVFAYPTVVSARKYQARGNVFLYYFTFEGSFKDSSTKADEDRFHLELVNHGEELNYIFFNENINQSLSKDSAEVKTWDRMVKMWSNFVINGRPTVGADDLLQNVDWLPVNQTSTRYLWIDKDLKMVGSDVLADRMALWDTVAAASSSTFIQPTLLAIFICVSLLSLKSN